MRIIALFTFVIGLALAGAAVLAVSQQFDDLRYRAAAAVQAKETAAPQMELQPVLVATQALKYGNRLRPDMVKVVNWPVTSAPEGSFASGADVFGDDTVPRTVLRSMAAGEPILKSRITGFGERATISSKLTDGKRAVTLRINDVTGVAGFLLPGDRVDIMLTRQSPNKGGLVTDVILQNIAVIGIDQLSDEDRNKPMVGRSATVEVEPEEAQKLALATRVGSLSLSLRQVGAVDQVQPKRISQSDLLKENVEIKENEGFQIRVRRAQKVTVTSIN